LAIVGNASLHFAEVEANAALMGDAPRLLEVLRKVLTYADLNPNWDGIVEAGAVQAFTDANALLAKHGG
jgi:hypothetical protein